MAEPTLDMQERLTLCDLFDVLGADAPTLLDGWTAHDIAAHLVQRERDPIAGPCMVLPGRFQRIADRRRATLVQAQDFDRLVERLRSGPPGFFRLGWVSSFPSLNEYFVHHEDVRRANGLGPRLTMSPALEAALWRNACRGGRYLSRRLSVVGLELAWAGSRERLSVHKGEPTAQISGAPGELLLYLFGRTAAAQVEVTGTEVAVATVNRTNFGM
jgi:uncharacterized protein (TIGR03085 family)